MFTTIWPHLTIFAEAVGEVDPYAPESAHLFRGEETFLPTASQEQRWKKPSPELQVDEKFRQLILAAIQQQAPDLSALVYRLAEKISAHCSSPPVLMAILRAGIPAAALLSPLLARHFGQPIPIVAFSLFAGVEWDRVALTNVLKNYPHRPILFIDGWTSSGTVARALRRCYQNWLFQGEYNFTHGLPLTLAVLSDPGGYADLAATHKDYFIPSSCFTAPETLGFSRTFTDGSGFFKTYRFPAQFIYPDYVHAWLKILEAIPSSLEDSFPTPVFPPDGWKLHLNEVVRTFINRNPQEVRLATSLQEAQEKFAPLIHLCQLRQVPIHYDCGEILRWGAFAAARLQSS